MYQNQVTAEGFAIAPSIFSESEIENLIARIEKGKKENPNFKGNKAVFAIRNFLKEFPGLETMLMTDEFKRLIASFGADYRIVKSIYFDKPPNANWVVNWHQDLTISIKNKLETAGFSKWLPKENYFSVQPPIAYSQDIITLRIHLDDCTKANGALRVIPKSHKGILEIKNLSADFFENEVICEIPKGGVLMMKPLVWHSSKRTENNENRRVIHIELSKMELPEPLVWAESSL
jgi:Phytanoyl-CoA dioxygenase (PhyH)